MPSSLVNSYTGTNIHFNEYLVSFSTQPIPGDSILIGYDYVTHNIIAEYNSQQIIVGQVPLEYFSTNDTFRLVITLDVSGTNNSYIPYTVYFDFSEDGSVLGSVDRNPFLTSLVRPFIDITLSSDNFLDDVTLNVSWNSDALDHVEIEVLTEFDVLIYSSLNEPSSGNFDLSNLLSGNYVVNATAFNEPLIFTTASVPFTVIATNHSYLTNSINNINDIPEPDILLDLLPVITSAVINLTGEKSVEVVYTTTDATYVDIITTFGVNATNLPPNHTYPIANLDTDILYTVTLIARDDEGNQDVRSILLLLEPSGELNSDRGIISLKRGRNMTFSVSPGIYTKETDLSGIAEPFVGTNGCFAGKFKWGPCLERVRIANEESLGVVFGKPSTNIDNAIDFMVAAQYLSYSSALDVVRNASFNGSTYLNKNSVVSVYFNTLGASSNAEPNITVLNDDHYTNLLDGDLASNSIMARYPGELGNSIGISFVTNATDYNDPSYKFSVGYDGSDADNANIDFLGSGDGEDLVPGNLYFSRNKNVFYRRSGATDTARSFFDLGDWLNVDDQRYQIKKITFGVEDIITGIDLTAGGSGYTSAPTVSLNVGSGPNTATATAVLASTGSVKTIAVSAGGTGYTSAPTVVITGGGGTGATATATLTSDSVTSITITSAGTGYTSTPTVTLTGGAGTGATATAAVGYAVASIRFTPGTGGYTETPTVAFSGTGTGAAATAVVGTIDTIEIDRLYTGVVSSGSYGLNTIVNPGITTLTREWRFSNIVPSAPTTNSVHLIVFDLLGKITGVAGSIVEKFTNLSFDADDKNLDGTSNYWPTRVNSDSSYIRVGTLVLSQVSLLLGNTEPSSNSKDWVSNYITLVNGDDSFGTMGIDDDIDGYNLFKDPEQTDAPIIIGNYRCIKDESGLTNSVLANYLIQNIAEFRKDSVVYLSCRREAVVNNPRNEVREILKDAATLPSTSYAEMDSGWKYIYDKYNDRYLWVPTSGDHAGCYARTDRLRDPWYSAAGEQRGILNNVVKLAFNPNETQRDQLYANRVNPVITIPGRGTMLYGDKTLLSLASGFNRIPTRRLFIVLEKTLANAARFAMFEFNDSITQTQVYGLIDHYLRDVKGRRGVEDYAIDVGDKVNTPEVVANNQFKGRIYIKPKYSINFIELNFINVGAILSFDEAVAILNNTI